MTSLSIQQPLPSNLKKSKHIEHALTCLQTEKTALDFLMKELDDRFDHAIDIILACTGRVVVTGMGKSGHIGRKIAATLASTGTPSFFMHPGEAAHGDLGMLVAGDVLIAISNSGESDEILTIIPAVKHHHIPMITISRDDKGQMAKHATVALTLGNAPEACPLGLAPTSSTTATLALGDALAVALLEARNFTQDDFARSHPAGALGRRLLTYVRDVMHTAETLPIVTSGTSIRAALLEMTSKMLGMTAIVDAQGKLLGIFTDGDLRRTLEVKESNLQDMDKPIDSVMKTNPLTTSQDMLAFEALELMNGKKINQLLVIDDNLKLIGALNIHDLLKAGIA